MRHRSPALSITAIGLTAAALLVAGCGSDNKDNGKASSSTPSTPTTTATNQGNLAASLKEDPSLAPQPLPGQTGNVTPRVLGSSAGTTYCSPTGDYCTGVRRRGGDTLLAIATVAFRGIYRLCISGPPTATRGCQSFRLIRRGRIYASTVIFSPEVSGRYTATWFYGGARLGRALSFRA